MKLFNLVDRIVEPSEKDDLAVSNEQKPQKEMLMRFLPASNEQMLHNALIIPAKIAGAHGKVCMI